MVKFFSILLLSLFSFGCIHTRPLQTLSGYPEVVMHTHDRDRIQRALVEEMEKREYQLERRTEHWIVFTKPVDDFDMSFFYGAGWNASATFRVFCSFTEKPNGTLVSSQVNVVTDLGTPEEASKPAPLGNDLDHDVQTALEWTAGTVALERHSEIAK